LKKSSSILFIASEFPPGPGGIGNHAWNLSRNLNNYYPVHILTVSDYANHLECSVFDSKEKINIHRFKRYRLSILTIIKRIYDIIYYLNKHDYSHCILSGRFILYTSSIIHYFSGRTKLIAILHGSELVPSNKISKLLLVRSLRKLNAVISVSRYTESLIPKNTVSKSKRYIIPNGVNKNIFSKTKFKKSINMQGYPLLLTVGSITHRKGQINLVKVLPLIIKQFPKVHYHCIGLDIEAEELLNTAKELGVDKNITIHGYLPNNQLNEIYRQSDILIMLSQNKNLYDIEGFGIVILEANLCGISAIGSKETGIEDAIIHNKTGLLVDPYNRDEIIKAINQIIFNKELFSKNAATWAQTHDWSNIVNRYLQVIENA